MQKFNYYGSSYDIFSIYPHMKWGKFSGFRSISENDDIPSRAMRETVITSNIFVFLRYTLTRNERTISVDVNFSHLKYIVVQFIQKVFTILVTYLICWKNARADYFYGFFLLFFESFLFSLCSAPLSLRFAFEGKKIRYRKICDTLFLVYIFNFLFKILKGWKPYYQSVSCPVHVIFWKFIK